MNQYFTHENERIYNFAGYSTKPIESIESFWLSSDPYNEWIEEGSKLINGWTKFAAVSFTPKGQSKDKIILLGGKTKD